MFRKMAHILHGALVWSIFRFRCRIDKTTVVLVLTGDNEKLDFWTVAYLEKFLQRKCAEKAVILFHNRRIYGRLRRIAPGEHVRWCRWKAPKIKLLYDYYSFFRFSDRVVFTYTDWPKENQLGNVLRETDICEREAVCLGLYRLREVPSIKNLEIRDTAGQKKSEGAVRKYSDV